MNELTLCVGADVHLDEIVLRAVDKTDGHEVLERFHVTNNLPGAQSAATTLAQAAAQHGYTHLVALLFHPGRRSVTPTQLGVQSVLLAQVSRSLQVSAQTRSRFDGSEARAVGVCPAHEESTLRDAPRRPRK